MFNCVYNSAYTPYFAERVIMQERQYPCITLAPHSDNDGSYFLEFRMNAYDFFVIEHSTNYQQIAERGLQNSFHVQVPFFNEVKS